MPIKPKLPAILTVNAPFHNKRRHAATAQPEVGKNQVAPNSNSAFPRSPFGASAGPSKTTPTPVGFVRPGTGESATQFCNRLPPRNCRIQGLLANAARLTRVKVVEGKARRSLNLFGNPQDCHCYTSFGRSFAAERPVTVHLNVATIVYARPLRDADALGGCV
jgi:hypothetical protein